MNPKPTIGFSNLLNKVMAVISTSVTSLLPSNSNANIIETNLDMSPSVDAINKLVLKPRLVLRLHPFDPSAYTLSMHTSHSSHSSHSSHASSSSSGHSSHSSHSSHFSSSSSSSYTPANTVPYSTAPLSLPAPKTFKSPRKLVSKTNGQSFYLYDTVLKRVLYKGCEGTDVEDLQNVLIALGYDVLLTGYFGDKTVDAVIKFQKENELRPDGKVTSKTFTIMQNKLQ